MPDVILPALGEADAIGWVLDRMPAGYHPIVVDNGSTDATAELAAQHGARVVHQPVRGFGSACWAGLQAATDDTVCFMDCDASLGPAYLPSLVAVLQRGDANLVVGERVASRGSWPAHARIANKVLAAEVHRRTKVRLRDLGPMRVAQREPLLALGLDDRRSGWPLEMVLRAHRAGWTVRGMPVAYHERAGRSKVTGTVRGSMRAVQDMSRISREDEAPHS